MNKEYCVYCGKEKTKKKKTGFYSRFTGNETYYLVCSNKKCPKRFNKNTIYSKLLKEL